MIGFNHLARLKVGGCPVIIQSFDLGPARALFYFIFSWEGEWLSWELLGVVGEGVAVLEVATGSYYSKNGVDVP